MFASVSGLLYGATTVIEEKRMEQKKSLDELKTAFLDAEKEYQFALVSGDQQRLLLALKNHRQTFSAFDKEFRRKFKAKQKARCSD